MADDSAGPGVFRITASELDDGRILAILEGELDLGTVPMFVERIEQIISEQPSIVELDLERLTFIDSSGIGAYVNLYRRAQASGSRVSIGARSPLVERVLQLSGVEDALTAEAAEG